VFHLGAVGGAKPPFWDQRAEFGDTNLLVVKPEEGASLARALKSANMVLMLNHGVSAVGTSVQDLTFRCYFSGRNAIYQMDAASHGTIRPLSAGEVDKAGKISTGTTGQARAWESWVMRLDKIRALPPEPGSARRVGFVRGERGGDR
jgi:hypothetical protein